MVVIGSVIFLAGRNKPTALVKVDHQPVFEDSEPVGAWDDNLQGLVGDLLSSGKVDEGLKSLHQQLDSNETVALLLQVAQQWEASNYALIAGYYYEKLALKQSTEENWEKAAFNLFSIQGQFSDTTVKEIVASHTVNALRHVLEINPDNLDASADLAYCMLENGLGMPMAAVSMFQTNLAKDSNHVKSLFYYGMSLYRIGKVEGSNARLSKSERMFARLAQIEPRPIYFQYLAEVQYAQGKKREAIRSYNEHVKLLKDDQAKKETLQLIRKIEQEL